MITDDMLEGIYKTDDKIGIHPKHKQMLEEYLTKIKNKYYYKKHEVIFNDNVPEDLVLKYNTDEVLNKFDDKINQQIDMKPEYINLRNMYLGI